MADSALSKPDIFLSYAREDEARAGQLAEALEQHGLAVFWDREVPPGETWHSHIGRALGNAECVVVAWSRHSIASDWVIEEASEGKRRKILVPVMFEEVQPPFGFGGIQAANLIDWRPGRTSPAFDDLLGAVRRIAGRQPGPKTGAEAELPSPPHPALSEPKPKPTVRPSTPSRARSEPRAEQVRPPNRQAGARSRRTLVTTLVGFVVIAGAGGAAVFWWRTLPEPTLSPPVTEAEPSTPSQGPPDRAAGTETAVQPATPPSVPDETGAAGEGTRDCPACPEMVLVPAGEFTMGWGEGRSKEGPPRKVTIAEPFWVGKYEVTFAEWDACAATGGCANRPDDAAWGREDRPVINVSWNDAKEYVGWLSQKTGRTYRLLSEAEWEYVARAGSTTAFWWGPYIGKGNANCPVCGSEWDSKKTAPVGSFNANDFGIYDTAGNVWEWVQDCWHRNYDGAPKDGSAWEDDDNDCYRVLRGGSWGYPLGSVHSASRGTSSPGDRNYLYGFRVARTAD